MGALFSFAVPRPPLRVTLNTIFPAAGEAFTIDAEGLPLSQPFDAWAVIETPGGDFYSMVLGQPWRLVPGAVPLALNVPGASVIEEVLLAMTLPPGLAPGAYTVTVALLPPGSLPAIENAIPGYGVQRIATIR